MLHHEELASDNVATFDPDIQIFADGVLLVVQHPDIPDGEEERLDKHEDQLHSDACRNVTFWVVLTHYISSQPQHYVNDCRHDE